MKLNEFKKPKINELDLSSFIGDYGSAGLRTGLGSLMGKNVLSTQDQMVKDQFVKNFTSRAFSGLQSGISSGLVDPTATGMTTSGANIGTKFGNNPVTNPVTPPVTNPTTQVKPTTGKNVSPTPAQNSGAANTAGANAFGQMANQLSTAKKSPEQIRQEKQAAATGVAQQQMANNGPFSKLPANQAAVQAGNIRQQKQGQAATTAQGQMAPVSKLPADQFAKTAASTRQQQQGQATTNAQGKMNPMSKLPADQFAKTATNTRQQQQTTATKTAQQQMAAPQSYQSNDPRFPNGKYDGVSGQPTPEYQKELDKSAASSAEKQKADAAASQAQSKSNDDMAANMNNIAAQRNMPNVSQATTPKISTGADAEQAALDKMKQKNPKLAGMMTQAGLDDIKPDNTVQMPKRNKKPKGKAAESTRFDKLNFLFESIIAEATMGQTLSPTGQVVGQSNQQQKKQSISQYITNFFKQFMKGVSISDPSVMTRLASLAKELEQTYNKDKGKSVLPKLAELGWSVQHAQAEEQPNNTPPNNTTTPNTTTPNTTTPSNPPSNPPPPPNTTTNNASGQKTKTAYQQIQGLLKDLTPANKQKILAALQKELAKDSELSIGGKKLDPNNPEDAKIIDMLKKQGKL